MATYYVRTTGNDSTGDGSTGTPWATLTKAMTVAGAGDTIKVGTGTYAENTSGSGFWQIAKSVASWLVIESESGVAADVVIQGTSGSSNTIFTGGTSQYLRFRNLTFHTRSGSSYPLRFNAACSYIDFDGCVVTGNGYVRCITSSFALSNITFVGCTISGILDVEQSGSGTASLTLTLTNCTIAYTSSDNAVIVSGTASLTLTLTNCTVSSTNTSAVSITGAATVAISGGTYTATNPAIRVFTGAPALTITGATARIIAQSGSGTISGGTYSSVELTNVATWSISGATLGTLSVNGATSIAVDSCVFSHNAAGNTCVFGVDGTSGNATSGSIKNTTITRSTSLSGHALLVGAGCSNFLAENVIVPQAYDYAIVAKENTGTEIRYCNARGGANNSGAAIYTKAATNPNIHHNVLIAGLNGFYLGVGDTGNKCSGVTLVDNRIIVRGSKKAMTWGGTAADSGGGVCDRNVYDIRGGTFGDVRTTTGITTLPGLRTAWSGYGAGTNDGASRLPPPFVPDL